MAQAEEENFPRGGRKQVVPRKRPVQNDNLFQHVPKAKKQKKSRKPREKSSVDESFPSTVHIRGTLSYNKVREGMLILGCVRHITNFTLEIELPGLTFGTVTIARISDTFTKYLNDKLENGIEESDMELRKIFKVGQFVLVKVVSVENAENNFHIECTMNPSDIYHGVSHTSFQKGMLIWACVNSVLDHGYEMNVGIKNCRVFLPSKNVDSEKTFAIGEPLWCTIHKCDSSNVASTLRVSSKEQHIKAAKTEDIHSLHNLIPGMQVEMVTEKITSAGIQGKFLNDYFGYIDETHLKYPLKQLSHYKEGKLINAHVLYVEPATNITHLTMRNLDPVLRPSLNIGDIISAEVISKAHNGIYLKLSDNDKGFVTNKRLLSSLRKTANQDITDIIRLKFAPGSRHTCRIMDYNRLSMLYVCTVEKSLVKEKIFSFKDVQVGQLLKVTVDNVKSDGLVVTSGHIRGFVPNLFLSNVKYSENIKKKFKAGYQANARVLNVIDGNIIFTLKSSQVESDNCLTELERAQRGDRYLGVVVQMKPVGALVQFYDSVKGWLSKRYLDGEDADKADPTQYFYEGQVINPWVLGVKGDKVILSLNQPSEFKTTANVKIGRLIKGIVGKIHKDKIEVKSAKGRSIGIVPVNHLSCSLSLCPSLLRTFKVGDEIKDLLCIDNKTQPAILSRREGLALNRSTKVKLRILNHLQPGFLVRCSYISVCKSGIYVLPLILDYTENILIENKDIVPEGEPLPKFKLHQSIVSRVLEIDKETKNIRLTIKLKEVFDSSVETTLDYFSQHLADIKYLRNFGTENDWGLCRYQPGERVECKVKMLGDKGGCVVSLPNNIKGLVAPRLCPDVIVDQTLEGVFLSQDFVDDYVEICLKRDICQKINKVQDGFIRCPNLSSCISENVLVKTDSVLGVLKQSGGNRQLVYIPLYLHENDTTGCKSYYDKRKLKLCVCGKVGNYLIGMSKKLFLTLDKEKGKILKAKSMMKKRKKTTEVPEALENNRKIEEQTNDEESFQESSERDETASEAEENNTGLDKNGQVGVKRKLENTQKKANLGDDLKQSSASNSSSEPLPVLPGVSSFFSPVINGDSDSSSDEEEQLATAKKKKKLTPAERAELARQEEERISKIERELADSTKAPERAEQFDRLLLANPNSSELWTKYMSFHIAATEFDKARSVAKKALQSIRLTLSDERLNVWIALLNLENMLGTKESFDKTFEEAIKYNDSLQIYLSTIKMLAEAGKSTDLEEKIRKVRNKHKQQPKMWLEVAKIYYSMGKFKDARNLKEAALKSIQDKRTQMEIIVRFAIMEFKYGEEEQGAAVFETILSSDPRKVNIWTTYVDQLVKKDRMDQARKVLERSICQRLPLKSMKTLFLKFRMFEEQHGTPDSVEAVKEKAKEYMTRSMRNN